MSRVEVRVTPNGAIADGDPTDAGWLGHQARRVLVLAALITGFWLIANLVSGAHASAAPFPGSAAVMSSTPDPAASITARVRHLATASVHTIRPVGQIVANLPTSARTSLGRLTTTVQVTTDKLEITGKRLSSRALQAVTRAVRVPAGSIVGSGPAATSATAPQAARSLRSGIATASSAGAGSPRTTTHRATAERAPTSRPAGSQRPTRSTASLLVGAGGLGAADTSGGAGAATLPSAAIAPDSVSGSALSSDTAAKLRSSSERPASSPG